MSVRMPEICVDRSRCGTDASLWLNGTHPQITNEIVTRRVCGTNGAYCCYWSLSIQVKACPGNYYVYEFVSPITFCGAYCADVNTIAPNISNSTVSSTNTTDTSDPCSVYTVLSDDWRKPGSFYYTHYSGYDDTLVEWSGWYRLYVQGSSAQIAESAWCSSDMTCGGYTPLFLGGTHPLPQDGIVTRKIYGSYGYVTDGSQCGSLKSNPIQVKACPGNYSVYRLVKPTVSIPMPTYCAVIYNTSSYDPCNNYTPLDQPWRGTNATGLYICDQYFTWNGWYRLLYYGMSVRMPESCVNRSRCGTNIPLWLNGTHPQITDGIVTRVVCGNSGSSCCSYRSTPVRVKACQGNYYVYEFVKTTLCNAAYCADVNTIAPNIANSTVSSTNTTNTTSDPCSVYTVLDNYWRSVYVRYNHHDDQRKPVYFYYNLYSEHDDTLVEWSGWYRLYLKGSSAQIAESRWCSRYMTCGGYTPLFLRGTHPLPQDGIVTREIYGSYGYVTDGSQCGSLKSNPIQVKACPGNYSVYRLVKPALSIPMPTYCAVSPTADPCNKYTSLDQPWRGTNSTGLYICDTAFTWNGWYRLLYYGMSIRMPESCVNWDTCGTYYPLWLNGPHPQITDGIVTRGVCGSWINCCYWSLSIQVKACPGNYYVYKFVSPYFCNAAYCADVNTIAPNIFNSTVSSTNNTI
ncbi:uncharacterized protein [Hoplias malabaricus]|uniref:uncharacterized protein n=1 Tax=Hoplias malabaricus TaxID=27720 RepID=UPI003462DEE6